MRFMEISTLFPMRISFSTREKERNCEKNEREEKRKRKKE